MTVTKRVEIARVELLQPILGTFDENLNIVCRELGVSVRVEGYDLVICGEEENAIKAESLPKGDGKFDRAFNAINDDLKTLETFVMPNLTGKDEWFSVLLGLRAGLTIAQHQLNIIKKSRN